MRKIEGLFIMEEREEEPATLLICDNHDSTGKLPYFLEIVNYDGTSACIALTEKQVEDLVAVFVGGKQ